MQLKCIGKQVKQEVLNNVKLNNEQKNTVPHSQLLLSRDAKILVECTVDSIVNVYANLFYL